MDMDPLPHVCVCVCVSSGRRASVGLHVRTHPAAHVSILQSLCPLYLIHSWPRVRPWSTPMASESAYRPSWASDTSATARDDVDGDEVDAHTYAPSPSASCSGRGNSRSAESVRLVRIHGPPPSIIHARSRRRRWLVALLAAAVWRRIRTCTREVAGGFAAEYDEIAPRAGRRRQVPRGRHAKQQQTKRHARARYDHWPRSVRPLSGHRTRVLGGGGHAHRCLS